ncbi:MAG: hypothetical protein JNJ57_13065 [Saprospiraceae bacterium]|nr:hypothetical protein [Saprospiraceae bacterium]
MKPYFILILGLFAVSPTGAQQTDFWNRSGDKLDLNKYPPDSFQCRQTTYDLHDTKVLVSILHYDVAGVVEDQVWVEQRKNGQLMKSRYLGSVSTGESGVAIPVKQMFDDYFIIDRAGEFTGIYYLIHPDGRWFELPGNFLTINQDKTALYTFVPEECGGCYAGTFLFDKQLVIKKYATGSSNFLPEGITEAEIGNLFKDKDWIWLKW